MYHDGYGGPFLQEFGPVFDRYGADDCIVSSNGVALASYFRSDNAGPPDTLAEVKAVVAAVRKIFPNAKVLGSSFDKFAAEALTPSVISALPVFDQDWGDQWLTGMSTQVHKQSAVACDSSTDSLRDSLWPQRSVQARGVPCGDAVPCGVHSGRPP